MTHRLLNDPGRTPASYMKKTGTTLTLHGQPHTLIGSNPYAAFWPSPYDYTDLVTDAPILGSYTNAARVFAFQTSATSAGVRSWATWDTALALFAANGIKVIPVLTDHWGTAHHALSDSASDRTINWYSGGYATDVEGVATYRNWVIEAVTRYRDDPRIAFWQLINEAQAPNPDTSCSATPARDALRAFTDDMCQLVRSIDPNHMVGVGIQGGGCGSNLTSYAYTQAGGVDVMDHHDYGHNTDYQPYPAEPLGFDDGGNGFLVSRDAAAANGAIFMIMEFGISWLGADGAHGGPLTRAQRATLYNAKVAAQLAAGSQGEFFYLWGSGAVSADPARDLEVHADDPALPLLAAYLP